MNQNARRNRLICSIPIFVLLAGLLLPMVRVQADDLPAQTSSAACHNLDLVVLVDQSASMRNNDVNRQRIEVPN